MNLFRIWVEKDGPPPKGLQGFEQKFKLQHDYWNFVTSFHFNVFDHFWNLREKCPFLHKKTFNDLANFWIFRYFSCHFTSTILNILYILAKFYHTSHIIFVSSPWMPRLQYGLLPLPSRKNSQFHASMLRVFCFGLLPLPFRKNNQFHASMFRVFCFGFRV